MITKAARSRLASFVNDSKNLLTEYVTEALQGVYGIWTDGTVRPIHELPTKRTDEIHTARLLRQRLDHIKNALPGEAEIGSDEDTERTTKAIGQLVSEQAFTLLNRMAAIRMAGERNIIQPAIQGGFDSVGFQQYDAVTGGGAVGTVFERYTWYLYSIFDELSVELPAVFNRYSPYGLIWFDEMTLKRFFELINAEDLSAYYDTATDETINFWQEDETLGWIFQYYNSIEERRKMREESGKPRNSREMAVRNQFFTPDYVVAFLTDNSLGRIWWEMTGGKSEAIVEHCRYLIHRPDESFETRPIKDPTEITLLDPTCGSMHFGLYAFGVFEVIYMDAWDNYPELLQKYKYEYTREQFHRLVPKLILENNIFGVEIDPRALQIAAVSLWLRAQKSWDEQGVEPANRPLIRKSNLVLAEPMPGNKKLLRQLTEGMDAPMKKLVNTVWEKMSMAGEAGLLLKMESEIEKQVEDIRKNWHKYKSLPRFIELTHEEEAENRTAEQTAELIKSMTKEDFFGSVANMLRERISQITSQMSENEGYENALFAEDAARGLAFIEMCYRRFDAIVMNPPFGEGSLNSSKYLDNSYSCWCSNLVCSFFIRMQDMLVFNGLLGAIFDGTVLKKSSYELFRQSSLCGYIRACVDTGWGVLDANVETSTLVVSKCPEDRNALFIDLREINPEEKNTNLLISINSQEGSVYKANSNFFRQLPNSVIGYNFNPDVLRIFQYKNLDHRSMPARRGLCLVSDVHFRLYYEKGDKNHYVPTFNGGGFSMFYDTYRDLTLWEQEGDIARTYEHFRPTGADAQLTAGVGYGKRGDILDAQVLKKGFFFTVEGQAVPNLANEDRLIVLGYLNSSIAQYVINLYAGQHKHAGYMKILPMPDYDINAIRIHMAVLSIVNLKRWWFSLDETNLEYRGFIEQLDIVDTLSEAFDRLQNKLTSDYNHYVDLVHQNDELWMDLAEIKKDSDFRRTLEDYTSKRPYEELLSIDKASDKNILNRKTLAAEIIQELVGMAFGRWKADYSFADKSKRLPLPELDEDIFAPLPFMPPVYFGGKSTITKLGKFTDPETGEVIDPQGDLEGSQQYKGAYTSWGTYSPPSAVNGLLAGGSAYGNLTDAVLTKIHAIWGDKAADIGNELVNILGFESLQDYLESPNGFFDYHFMRYTKSRRKAPIYWPLSTPKGEVFVWVYYPDLNQDTLKLITLQIDEHVEITRNKLNSAEAANDSVASNRYRQRINDLQSMKQELESVIALPYVPNHDDGVPVTAAPLRNLFSHRKWRTECEENWKKLEKGEYDWSHLAYSIFPARIRTKAKKDWCMALTHGLEELCENKPKPKKAKKTKVSTETSSSLFDEDSI